MQRPPATGGDALHELVSAGLAHVHCAQKSAVGNARGATEHARWVGRPAGDLGRRTARGRPRRRGRQGDVPDERGERQRDEPPDEGRPLGSVAQPQHSGDHIRQHEERHVDAADDDFPPRRLGHLDVLLQPDGRDVTEKQPAVRGRLELPEGRRTEHVGRPAAEVVEHQHQGERQPVADHREHLVPLPDAGRDQAGRDVEQQQFAVERQPVHRGPVDHDRSPAGDGDAPGPGEPMRAAGWVRLDDRWRWRAGWPAGVGASSRFGLGVTVERPDPAIGCYCH